MAHGKRKWDSIHETPDVSYISNPNVAHEHTDVPVTPVLKFVGGLFVMLLVACLAMLLMFKFFERREEAAELEASPLARQGADRLPPEPRLQLAPGFEVRREGAPAVDLSYDTEGTTDRAPLPQSEYWVVREEWMRQLTTYGWADQQAGTVRVPVEHAMRTYLERQRAKQQAQQGQPGGRPAHEGQPAPAETTPSASSSGHQTEQKHQ
jgi:hypothetical protein